MPQTSIYIDVTYNYCEMMGKKAADLPVVVMELIFPG